MNSPRLANEGSNDEKNKRELTSLERMELAGKMAAASLPLSYVSGYLIYTSYMGTFSIQLGSSDLLRTKYIYIGFHYLIFLVLIAAVFRGVMRIVEMGSVFRRRTTICASDFQNERMKALNALLERNVEPRRWVARRFQEYRGDFTVALLVIVFGAEVLFLNPERLGILLPIQIVYLTGVVIYQYSYIRELREPYTWGLVYGWRYVEDCRWWLFGAQFVAAMGLGFYTLRRVIVSLSALISSFRHIPSAATMVTVSEGAAWGCALLAFEMELIGLVSVWVSTERLKDMDDGARVEPDQEGEVQPGFLRAALRTFIHKLWAASRGYFSPNASTPGTRKRKIAIRIVFLIVPLAVLLALYYYGYLARWRKEPPAVLHFFIVYLPLALSLVVLSLVALIPALFRRRAQRLEYPKFEQEQAKKDSNKLIESSEVVEVERRRERWERLIRRLAVATILYVTTVLSFSFLIYPHIPRQKSGGNYATGGEVSVTLVENGSIQGCANVQLPKLNEGEGIVPLEEDSSYIYLANDHDGGGVRCWSWGAIGQQYYRPRVYTINRRCVAEIIDKGPVDESAVCGFGGRSGAIGQTGAAPGSTGTSSGPVAVPSPGSRPK